MIDFDLSSDPSNPPRRKQSVHYAGYWALVRAPIVEADQSLLGEAESWLTALPVEVTPFVLSYRYPRIVNRIVASFQSSRHLATYMGSLLVDVRGGRKGFPPDVLRDLMKVHMYFLRKNLYGPYFNFTVVAAPPPATSVAATRTIAQVNLSGAIARNRFMELEMRPRERPLLPSGRRVPPSESAAEPSLGVNLRRMIGLK